MVKRMAFGGGSESGLLKEQLANQLREEILSGRLSPGDIIVEIKWARSLGVGQTSVREALNILISEGFVEKTAGRSARVTRFSRSDLGHIQAMRGAVEGMAVRLLTERQGIDLTDLDQSLADMEAAALTGNMRGLVERDLRFHLLLLEKSGNRFLLEAGRRILEPLFAFTLVRVLARQAGPETFVEGLAHHKRIVDCIRTGDPEKAEQSVRHALAAFSELGDQAWAYEDCDTPANRESA